MNQLADIDFSFRKPISPVKKRSQSNCTTSFQKQFTSSELNFNNTSRFQQKKVLKKVKENELLNRIELTINKFNDSDKMLKEVFKFKPIQSKKNRKEKEN